MRLLYLILHIYAGAAADWGERMIYLLICVINTCRRIRLSLLTPDYSAHSRSRSS